MGSKEKEERLPESSEEEAGLNTSPESSKDIKKERKDKKDKKEKKDKLKDKERSKDKSEKKDKKRKNDNIEELEIDLDQPVPLSKKQKRLIKKGKVTAEQLEAKHPKAKPETDEKETKEEEAKKKKSDFGVWIGNLSYDTTKEDITRFIIAKTSTYEEYSQELNKEDAKKLVKITDESISRVNLPKKENKIKGFAYVDFPASNHVATAISLSEQVLNGRKLLIKDANSFEGRPAKDPLLALSKNPPSRILFVGNLSFDCTSELLEEHFRHCGEIVKIRMATFEDTGKCKGFAFVDFKDEAGATNALKDKSCKLLINRPLRMEFGEDRSKRVPSQRRQEETAERNIARERESKTAFEPTERPARQERPPTAERSFAPERAERRERYDKPRKPAGYTDAQSGTRVKSSIALASAQRASAAIVPSAGKRITFD